MSLDSMMDSKVFYTSRQLALLQGTDDGASNLIFDKLELHPVAINFTYGRGKSTVSLSTLLPDHSGFSGMRAGLKVVGGVIILISMLTSTLSNFNTLTSIP